MVVGRAWRARGGAAAKGALGAPAAGWFPSGKLRHGSIDRRLFVVLAFGSKTVPGAVCDRSCSVLSLDAVYFHAPHPKMGSVLYVRRPYKAGCPCLSGKPGSGSNQ